MSKFDLDRVSKNLQQLKNTLPPLIANQAVKYFTDTFKKQSWDGVAWKEVDRRVPGTKSYKYPKKKGLQRRRNPILLKTGTLRRAVSMSARVVSFSHIRLVVDLPYAAYHNEGQGVAKRQFMGQSAILKREQIKLIERELQKAWQA